MIEFIASLVGGAILAIVVDRLYRRWRADAADYELWIDVEHVSLTSEDVPRLETGMQYVVDGQVVNQPHVVELDIWSAGTKDVRADMFHRGLPIEVNLNVPVIKQLQGARAHAAESTEMTVTPAGPVQIAPSLIKHNMIKRYRFLTDGKPRLTWDSQVADLHVYDLDQEWNTPTLDRRIARVIGRVIVTALIVGFLALIIWSSLVPVEVRREWFAGLLAEEMPPGAMDDLSYIPPFHLWLLLIPMGVPALLVGLFSYAANASRMPRRAANARKSGISLAPKTSSESLFPPSRSTELKRVSD
jgi:hypothetical protein